MIGLYELRKSQRTPLCHNISSSIFARVSLLQIKLLKAEIWKQLFINASVEMNFKISMSNCWLPQRFWDTELVVLMKKWARIEPECWKYCLRRDPCPLEGFIGHCMLGNNGSWIREKSGQRIVEQKQRLSIATSSQWQLPVTSKIPADERTACPRG